MLYYNSTEYIQNKVENPTYYAIRYYLSYKFLVRQVFIPQVQVGNMPYCLKACRDDYSFRK
jgi:hypothetical protein